YEPSNARTENIALLKPGAEVTTCGVARCGSPLQSTSVKPASRALGTYPAGKAEGGAHLTRRTASPRQARYGISASIGSGTVRACATVVKAIVAPINATIARSPSLRRLPTSIRDPSLGVIDGCAMRLSGVVRHRGLESYKDVWLSQARFG